MKNMKQKVDDIIRRERSPGFIQRRNEDGFTLVELLVVIIIIGILAGIAMPLLANQTKEAVDSQVKSDVRNAVWNVTLLMQDHKYAEYVYVTDNSVATAPTDRDAEGMSTPAYDVNSDRALRVWVGNAENGSDATFVDVTISNADTYVSTGVSDTNAVVIHAWNDNGKNFISADEPMVFDSSTGGFTD